MRLFENKRDKDMINAMALLQEYCKEQHGCSSCPMFENCNSSDDYKRYPYYWNIRRNKHD